MTEHDHNRRAWDAMVRQKQRFARPANDKDFRVTLEELDPCGWLGDVRGRRILCLAAGGGRLEAVMTRRRHRLEGRGIICSETLLRFVRQRLKSNKASIQLRAGAGLGDCSACAGRLDEAVCHSHDQRRRRSC